MALVQPIAVNKDGTHEQTVRAVAQASWLAYTRNYKTNPEPWEQWLSGPFTKSVRKANDKTLNLVRDTIPGSVPVMCGNAWVIGFPPMEEPLPTPIKRMQVADLERERNGFGDQVIPGFANCVINPFIDMTTGKTAAQVAHAWFAFNLRNPWYTGELFISDTPEAWNIVIDSPELIEIKDAGHTEVEPGTMTCIIAKVPRKEK